MKSNVIILQQGGLGDIFFIQKLCKSLSKSYNVYHPVTQEMWKSGVCQLVTDDVICGTNIDLPTENVLVYDCSNQPKPNGSEDIMTSKYASSSVSWHDWKDYFAYDRDHDREKHLKDTLGIKDGEPFIFHNMWYSFRKPHHGVDLTIPEDYDGKIVYMNPSHTDRVFDWCWIIENAEQIHTVDTCINYIIDTLDIKADTLICHPRHYKNTEECVGKLFSAPWQWVEYEHWLWREKVPEELE